MPDIDFASLLAEAAQYARPPISNFRVGSVARGTSGKLYHGANVELAQQALSFTVHAEQSAVVNAWLNGETGIDVIATSAAPCGYCRQFLNELTTAPQLEVFFNGALHPLSKILPESFGPRDLGITGGLMQQEDHGLVADTSDALDLAALDAANRSYAPYSKSFGGVALRTASGRIVAGPYAENAAFNPSMSPMQVALAYMNMLREPFESIEEAALAYVDDLHTDATSVMLQAVADVPLRLVAARNSDHRAAR
jgi:cytidine deaminase